MASLQLRIVPSAGPTIAASRTISDANVLRILAAGVAMYPGRTNQQLLELVLDRIVAQAVALTKGQERAALTVDDIPVT
jgi:hypothetical protein